MCAKLFKVVTTRNSQWWLMQCGAQSCAGMRKMQWSHLLGEMGNRIFIIYLGILEIPTVVQRFSLIFRKHLKQGSVILQRGFIIVVLRFAMAFSLSPGCHRQGVIQFQVSEKFVLEVIYICHVHVSVRIPSLSLSCTMRQFRLFKGITEESHP